MDVPEGFDPVLILVLNLAGTFVFGLSGGLAAVRAVPGPAAHRSDGAELLVGAGLGTPTGRARRAGDV
jgi:hypothetical protein